MNDIVIARILLTSVLRDIDSLMHELTEDELDALIDELSDVYEKYNGMVDARTGAKQ
jgi:hypothetical protein